MNITKQLVKVFVLPSYNSKQNVVCRVQWSVKFEEGGHESAALVETFLNVDNLQDFIPANEIGNDTVLQWAFDAQGGDSFMQQITPYHTGHVAYLKRCAGQQEFTDGFQLVTPVIPTNIPSQVL